jgi:hypothetical protein
MTNTSDVAPPTSSPPWSLTGKSVVEVTERRTAVDMAHFLRRLSDDEYPTATAIVLVLDNLNIHELSCLYEAFEPSEARRLVERFEIHHSPKHGSWLNVAEIFLSTLSRRLHFEHEVAIGPNVARLGHNRHLRGRVRRVTERGADTRPRLDEHI